MDLFYLNIIPIIASFVGPIYLLLMKKRISRAQWLLMITMIIVGVTLILYNIWNSTNKYNNCIYDFLFTFSGILCPPLYYLFICEYTERKGGLKLKSRRAFIPAVIYLTILSICTLGLGAEQYDSLVSGYQSGLPEWDRYDNPFWNMMIVWNYYGSIIFLIAETLFFVFIGWRKLYKYLSLLKSYQNELTKYALFFSRFITFFSVTALIIACSVLIVIYTGTYFEGLQSLMVIVITLLQLSFGFLLIHLDYDATKMDPIIKKLTYK